MTEKVKLLLHNAAPECASATEATLKQLPGDACLAFARDADGAIIVRDGWVEAETGNRGFLEFAAIQQGYVKAVKGAD